MSSTNFVDFSVRPNKHIERTIVFRGLSQYLARAGLSNLVYAGLGSVWFADFLLAHRELGIDAMYSVERDPVVYRRALFNRPYRTLDVFEGESREVVPVLLDEPELKARPWIVWLDYDKELEENRRDELFYLLANLPPDSVLLTTFSALGRLYGAPRDRLPGLRELFGDALPESVTPADVKSADGLMAVLADAVQALLVSRALEGARPGGYCPAFRLIYRDSTPMVTVGGFLPSQDHAESTKGLVGEMAWPGIVGPAIRTPPLTPKEVGALQGLLPCIQMPTREDLKVIGFDLEQDKIDSFVTHYLEYPLFVQIAR